MGGGHIFKKKKKKIAGIKSDKIYILQIVELGFNQHLLLFQNVDLQNRWNLNIISRLIYSDFYIEEILFVYFKIISLRKIKLTRKCPRKPDGAEIC